MKFLEDLRDIATIMSTREFLAHEQQKFIKTLIEKLVAEGKASRRRGWVMSEVLGEVKTQLGEPTLPYAKQHLVQNVCGMKEGLPKKADL